MKIELNDREITLITSCLFMTSKNQNVDQDSTIELLMLKKRIENESKKTTEEEATKPVNN